MPPVLAGAGVIALGKVAGTAIVASVLKFAVIGAVVGVATALVTGGDVRDAAIKGALMGAVTGGVMGVMGAGTQAAAGTATAGQAGSATVPALNPMNPGVVAQGQIAAQAPAAMAAPAMAQAPVQGGLLSRMGGWIEANPNQAAIVSQTVGGAAQGMQEARTSRKEIEALMERDRLNREAHQISGLAQSTVQTPNYRIDSFLDKPKWQENGLLSARS